MTYSATALKAVKTGIGLAIPHEMSTPEWAATYRVVDRGARKGKWSNETVPFLTEIMAVADDPFVREVVLMKSSQVGGSEVINNIIGKRIHQNPTDIIYCAEKEDKAKAWTQEAFDTMVRATPELRRLIFRDSESDNQKVKRYAGGGLYIVWATSPAELSSRPAQILCFDEKAAYKPTREGDAVKLGQARQKTYDGEDLTIFISTPRQCFCGPGETCQDISHDYERGDQRQYYVPCPHCDEFQTLKFGGKDCDFGLKWDKETPEMPFYLCEHCKAVIEEFDRDEMLAKGYWLAAKEFNGTASFKISQLYSPFVAWGKLVTDFLEAKTDPAKLEVFTNTELGETWKPIESIAYEMLSTNFEVYKHEVPDGVLLLTAGVDIQKNRIECEVVGWGKEKESWSIDYHIFEGDTGIDVADAADSDEQLTSVWFDLADYLIGTFAGSNDQAFRIQCVAIDSGYQTNIVYRTMVCC
jgi:phage terminase large subunit GpA-like protein